MKKAQQVEININWRRNNIERVFYTRPPWITCSDTILNHGLTLKFKLMCERKFNIILSNTFNYYYYVT